MQPALSNEVAAHRRRSRRPWRILFVIYAIVLTIGTHWPRLELAPEVPTTDKTLHLMAFGTLTILLWRTGWIRSRWLCALIAVLWAGCDESSQGIPGVNRHVSWDDMAGNTLGVLIALTWLWAMRPVGIPGAGNRTRLRLHAFVFDEMFTDWRAWMAIGAGAFAGGLPLLVLWPLFSVDAARAAIMVAAAISAGVTLLLWWRLWKQTFERVIEAKPCLECGAPSHGESRCARCGAAISPAQWIAPGPPPMQMMLQSSRKPLVIAFIVLLCGFGIIFLVPVLYSLLLGAKPGGWGAPRIARMLGTRPDLMSAIDLSSNLILFGVLVRVYRGGIARFYDRAVRCVNCGHDLRGTPTDDEGVGTCGECGTAFVRANALRGER